MTLHERAAIARGIKWVDEVVEGVPYNPTIEILNKLSCDYNAHGDDIAKDSTGEDSNIEIKKAGRMKIFKRTEGVSTTDIVGRLLQITQLSRDTEEIDSKPMMSGQYINVLRQAHRKASDESDEESKVRAVKFLATSRRLRQFSNNNEPKATDKIVYVSGSFDIFHCGDVELLQKAKGMGDFLLVGIYDDKTCREIYGLTYPILSLHERILNVLACKYVDEVVIGAPWFITEDLVKSFNIQLIVDRDPEFHLALPKYAKSDNYQLAREKEIYTKIILENKITIDTFIERILNNRDK